MSASADHIARLIQCVNKDIMMGEDGYQLYWPGHNSGAFSAWMLRAIADELDRVNKDWDDHIAEYFAKENQL